MGLDARFELRIDSRRVLEIHAHPQTHPDTIADMLQDAVFSLRHGLAMMNPGTDHGDSCSEEPPPVEWTYFNYNPQNFTTEPQEGNTTLPAADGGEIQENKPHRDFYGEQPLIGEITYTVNGIPATHINYHPAMGIDEIAHVLEDAAKDLRQKLASRQPVQHDARTVSLTVPAIYVGQHLLNQLNSYSDKIELALLAGDHKAAEKFMETSEKLYEWMARNYTPEAIKNSTTLEYQARQLRTFRGIHVPLNTEERTQETTP